jgi:hypothetical protein
VDMAKSDDIGEGLNIFKISDELNFRRQKWTAQVSTTPDEVYQNVICATTHKEEETLLDHTDDLEKRSRLIILSLEGSKYRQNWLTILEYTEQ